MYKKLILLSTLSVGLAASPALMAKPGLEPHRTATGVIQQQYDRGQQQPQRGNEHDDRGGRGNGNGSNNDRNDHADRGDHNDRSSSNHRNDRDRDDRHENDHRGNNHDHDRDWTRNERERQWQGARYRVASYHPPHGYQRHQWHHGDRVPASYRSHRYVVNDYHAYRLRTPPRGHQWIRVDRDVVLTVVATGVVAAVVYGIFQ